MATDFRNRIKETRVIRVEELQANPSNWRRHPAAQANALRGLLSEVGIVAPIIAYESERHGGLVLLDGHLRQETGGEWPVTIVDVTDEEADVILATFDPITGLAEMDTQALAELLGRVEMTPVEDEGVKAMLEELATASGKGADTGEPVDAEPQIDRAEELRQKWGVERGQLWQLGQHRLICGDCTDADVVGRVMDGEKAEMVFTDPPYGVNVTGAGGKPIAGDISFTAIPLMFARFKDVLAKGAWLYICGGQSNMLLYSRMFEEYCRQLPRIIVWDKGRTAVMRHNGYHSCYEFIYFSFMEGGGNKWYGPRDSDSADDIWRMPAPENKGRMHVTEKPVDLPSRAIRNSSTTGGIIWEPFSGSGSTLIAAENLGRRCYAVEISPGYVAVALERWHAATGKTPVLLEGAG